MFSLWSLSNGGLVGLAHVKGHPRYGLVLGDFCPLDQLHGVCLIVEGNGEDSSGWRPGAGQL